MAKIWPWSTWTEDRESLTQIMAFTRRYQVWMLIEWYAGRPLRHRGTGLPHKEWQKTVTRGRCVGGIRINQTSVSPGLIGVHVLTQDGLEISIPVRCIWRIETTDDVYTHSAEGQRIERQQITDAQRDKARYREAYDAGGWPVPPEPRRTDRGYPPKEPPAPWWKRFTGR